mgnify:CR=1 FL=1
MLIGLGLLALLALLIGTKSFKVVGQAEVLVIERLGISGGKAPHPALTNAARLLEAWTWSIQDYLETRPSTDTSRSFQ